MCSRSDAFAGQLSTDWELSEEPVIPSRADAEGPRDCKLQLAHPKEALIAIVRSLGALRQPRDDMLLVRTVQVLGCR